MFSVYPSNPLNTLAIKAAKRLFIFTLFYFVLLRGQILVLLEYEIFDDSMVYFSVYEIYFSSRLLKGHLRDWQTDWVNCWPDWTSSIDWSLF